MKLLSNYMAHERAQWNSLSEDQLLVRLKETTGMIELNWFIQEASTRWDALFLEQSGYHRWNELFADQHPLQKGARARWKLRHAKFNIIYEPEFRMIR